MATILFEGTEFDIGPELTAGRVLGAACMRYGEPGDFFRFKLFDERGHELEAAELVGKRRLALWDVRKLRANLERPRRNEHRHAVGAK